MEIKKATAESSMHKRLMAEKLKAESPKQRRLEAVKVED